MKDMTHDWIQLLQTLLMVRCKCNLHGCREDETETDIHDERKKKKSWSGATVTHMPYGPVQLYLHT